MLGPLPPNKPSQNPDKGLALVSCLSQHENTQRCLRIQSMSIPNISKTVEANRNKGMTAVKEKWIGREGEYVKENQDMLS